VIKALTCTYRVELRGLEPLPPHCQGRSNMPDELRKPAFAVKLYNEVWDLVVGVVPRTLPTSASSWPSPPWSERYRSRLRTRGGGALRGCWDRAPALTVGWAAMRLFSAVRSSSRAAPACLRAANNAKCCRLGFPTTCCARSALACRTAGVTRLAVTDNCPARWTTSGGPARCGPMVAVTQLSVPLLLRSATLGTSITPCTTVLRTDRSSAPARAGTC